MEQSKEWRAWEQHIRAELGEGAKGESSEWGIIESEMPHSEPSQQSGDRKPPRWQSFLADVRRYTQQAQRIGLSIALGIWVLSPLIQDAATRQKVISLVASLGFAMVLLSLNGVARSLRDLSDRISGVAKHVGRLDETVKSTLKSTATGGANFAAIQPTLERDCRASLREGQDLQIELLVVAAHYSWPFFREFLIESASAFPRQRVDFHIAFVSPATLRSVGAHTWAARCEANLAEIRGFASTHGHKNLHLSVTTHTLLLGFHGILINQKILYKGATTWAHGPDDRLELKVGSCPYLRFENEAFSDSFEPKAFLSWVKKIWQSQSSTGRPQREANRPPNAA